ncbi:hypothetical protein ONS95_007600 [Cadophora gregata]|uniref:uncharacterized protein n=1 Tax=Cadophora gregata TaxID=51156 RepID=UPI0026DD4809|nr:uncharacterized protein ONS95_007600 [Cadophora gregata]KAK0118714.1 hypothetical protein ONS96_011802 [Cadophora gregata f. sp. sojae]KAK0125977.1 hypothetical protein ONS95_007600 [Cadophora gregata]
MPRPCLHKGTLASSDNWESDIWKADDDWTEVGSKEEKKRRQNRINQRAYRRRNPINGKSSKQRSFRVERFRITDLPVSAAVQKEKQDNITASVSSQVPVREDDQTGQHASPAQETSSSCVEHMQIIEAQAMQVLATHPEHMVAAPDTGNISVEYTNYNTTGIDLLLKAAAGQARSGVKVIDPYGSKASAVSSATSTLATWIQDPSQSIVPQIPQSAKKFAHLHSRDPDGQGLFRVSLEQLVSPTAPENEILTGKPLPLNPNGFPLSSDHLLRLIHFNVFRGLITNKAILSGRTFQVKVELDFVLPESNNLCDGLTMVRSKPGQALPKSLYPTYIQASVAHSSWINMFPFPAIRDNLIRAEKDFDHEDLCYDLFGEMFISSPLNFISKEVQPGDEEFEDDITARRKGLIIWGEPWDASSWEVTPGFARKWAWVLENCHQLIESTNRWRAKRDEKPLDYYLDNITL